MNLVCPACASTNRVSERRLDEKPALVLFDKSSEVARISGAVPAGQLVKWVKQHVARRVA